MPLMNINEDFVTKSSLIHTKKFYTKKHIYNVKKKAFEEIFFYERALH